MPNGNPPPVVVDEAIAELLRQIYESAPLYRKYPYTPAGQATRPSTIIRYCSICRHEQPWEVERGESGVFRCRACRSAKIVFHLYWGETDGEKWIMKVGQYPALDERITAELEQRLGSEDQDLYRKALRSRNFNFGLGALSYLRRVVENKTNELLDLLAEAATESGHATELVAKVAEAKASYRFEDKVALAADLLPSSLRPGGINPLHALHDLASSGIHHKSEGDCIDLFDKARTGFEYVFRQLQVEKTAALDFVNAMKKLDQARTQA